MPFYLANFLKKILASVNYLSAHVVYVGKWLIWMGNPNAILTQKLFANRYTIFFSFFKLLNEL